MNRQRIQLYVLGLMLVASFLPGCSTSPTAIPIPPTATAVPPTATHAPPTATITLVPRTATPIPPTKTPTITPTPTKMPTPELSLRAFAFKRHILIGAAVSTDSLRKDTLYSQTLSREFSVLTPENVMKFAPLHPAKDRYDFREADALVDFAGAQSMQVRGHTLVWHNNLPNWLTEGKFSRDELIAILREHIVTVVGRYRSRVAAWDVVNEAINDDGSLRDTIWLRGIGPGYIDLAFRWAHETDPQARLFYNDYGGEGLGRKSDAIYSLVQGMLQRGVPINGVGLQMHLSLESPPKPQDISSNIKRLGALSLDVHITEMDVRIKGTPTADNLTAQARIYGDIFQACLSSENCKAFVTWGFTDRYSWIPDFFKGYGAGLLFDESYRPKPAYKAIMGALTAR